MDRAFFKSCTLGALSSLCPFSCLSGNVFLLHSALDTSMSHTYCCEQIYFYFTETAQTREKIRG
jgi:hypothetical protein